MTWPKKKFFPDWKIIHFWGGERYKIVDLRELDLYPCFATAYLYNRSQQYTNKKKQKTGTIYWELTMGSSWLSTVHLLSPLILMTIPWVGYYEFCVLDEQIEVQKGC